jgi:hypothetical protein
MSSRFKLLERLADADDASSTASTPEMPPAHLGGVGDGFPYGPQGDRVLIHMAHFT